MLCPNERTRLSVQTVTWLLHGPIHTPTATLVGASAVWAAIAGAAPGAGQAAGQAERGMQVAQARAALDGPADPATVAGIWGWVGEESLHNG